MRNVAPRKLPAIGITSGGESAADLPRDAAARREATPADWSMDLRWTFDIDTLVRRRSGLRAIASDRIVRQRTLAIVGARRTGRR